MTAKAKISIKDVLIDFMKENIPSLLGYLFFSLAVPVSNIYLPHLYGKIISALNEKHVIDRDIRIRFVCIFLLWILVQFFWLSMNILDSKFVPKLRSHVRKYIVQKVLDTYSENYSEEELGGIIAEIVRLPEEVDHMFGNIRNHIMPMAFMLIFSIGYFTWTDPQLGAAGAIAISTYVFIAIRYSMGCLPDWLEMNSSHHVLHGEINDSLGNLLNIYTANQKQSELDRLDGYETHFLEKHRQAIRCSGNYRLLLNLLYIFLFASINILSFYLFTKGRMEIGKVVSVLIISLELISKMAGFIGSVDRIMHELSIIKHVQEALDLLSMRSTTQEPSQVNTTNVPMHGDIQFKNVCVKYGDSPVLANINLTIQNGKITVIVGEIGSGKTSLINALIRLIPYTGTITVGNHDIKSIDIGYLREHILYVPQNPRLFNRTIYENISYGNGTSREDAQKVLDRYNLDIDLDRNVGKYGQWLSGGQRQIVYLLRCLFKNSPIVLLDEPTASLDHATKHYILEILADLLSARTVIIISHDPDVLQYAENIVTLSNGKLKSSKEK